MTGIIQGLLASIGSAVASAASDAYFNLVTLLLNTTSTNGAQNNTFLDSSSSPLTITRNGNTTQGTFTPFSQTGWSNYFDGSDDDLAIASDVKLTPAAGDFTLECWIYPTSWGGSGTFRAIIAGPVSGCMFFGQTSTNFGLRALAIGDIVVTSTLPTINTWTHVAVSRSGTTARLFINGTLTATATDSTNFPQTQIVIANTSVAGSEDYAGYISNLRFVKGTALYTSTFTPSTTPLTAVTNTQLLTCQSNRFIDNSANAFALSIGGTPSVQAFSPFLPTSAYDTSVVGGSGYFDGTGDYLNGPNASGGDFGTGSFTISFWFYPTVLTGGVNSGIISYADTGGWNGWQLQVRGSTKDILFEFLTGSAGASQIVGGSIALNAWNYVAIVRSGSTVSMYVNSTTAATSTTNSTAYGAAGSRVLVAGDRLLGSLLNGYMSNVKLVKQANAPASIPTAPDTNTTNTSLLLNFTNAGIFDSAAKNVTETVGNTQVSTTQAKWGTTSMSFDGTGDYLTIPNSPTIAVGSGDFAIECWWYPTDLSASSNVWCLGDSRSANNGLLLYWSSGSGKLILYSNGSALITSSINTTTNAWYYINVVRSGSGSNNLTLYINGSSAGTATNTTSFAGVAANGFAVCAEYAGSFGAGKAAYFDDVRITKGYARSSTSPTAAFPLQ